jgi:hypothetical protein
MIANWLTSLERMDGVVPLDSRERPLINGLRGLGFMSRIVFVSDFSFNFY